MNFKFIKIDNIRGTFYTCEKRTNTIIIYGIGAPIPPDNGTLPDASIILEHNIDIFVPDYIGYGRSDGIFTPINCIRTFLNLYKNFINGCTGKNYYENSEIGLKYKRVIFIGRSFGGTYIPLLPKFNEKIKELAIFCPVVDSKSCGSVKGEESNKDFLRSMKDDGYHYLYRGILDPIWKEHLENRDDLSPMDNMKYLKDIKLFIAHGKLDKCVHFSKSVKYYEKIINMFPKKKKSVILKLYPKTTHGSSTTNLAAKDFLEWIKV
jgi:hypothetical protein